MHHYLFSTTEQSSIHQQRNSAQVLPVPATATTEQNATCTHQAMIVLSGKLIANNKIQLNDSITEIKAVIDHLEKKLGVELGLTIHRIDEGSVRITLGGSPEDLEKLQELFRAGELDEVLGIPVEDVQLVERDIEEDSNTDSEDKSRIVQEIITQRAEGQNLSGANLSGADLISANLSGADLISANLNLADLRDADLRGADLRGADLRDANLNLANLNLANLNLANLRGANLRGADLRGADLRGADLRGADLSGSNLSYAYLRGAKVDDATRLDEKWRLVWQIVNQGAEGRNLSGADLRYANLSYANLSGADLSGADLSGANLSGADLSGADLISANLSYADLRGAKVDDATRLDEKWRLVWQIVNQGAEGRNLSGADLSGANLSYANLSGADLSGANLSYADLFGANLSGADLSGANLSDAKVEKARFGDNLGISESMKRDLIERKAIFKDSPGDRSGVPIL